MRTATIAELAGVAAAAVQSHVVDSPEELLALHAEAPWHVCVSGRGEAAVLDRWREGSADCAVLGLWCAPRRVAELVGELEELVASLGFERLLSPLVPEEAARPYLDAGMRVVERVDVMRLDARSRAALSGGTGSALPPGVTLREACPADLHRLAELDAACFDGFWRYDERLLGRLLRTGHVLLAEEDSVLIGYTLATVHGADGSLGRLAVSPGHRCRGVGRALADASLRWLAERGVRSVFLTTQEHNGPSRALYRSLGFVQLPGRLVACVSGVLTRP